MDHPVSISNSLNLTLICFSDRQSSLDRVIIFSTINGYYSQAGGLLSLEVAFSKNGLSIAQAVRLFCVNRLAAIVFRATHILLFELFREMSNVFETNSMRNFLYREFS